MGGGVAHTFDLSGTGQGWTPSSVMLTHDRSTRFNRKINVCGIDIIPMGNNNDLPGEVLRLLDNFYAGEGIMGKITGLQWGDGPRFFTDAIDTDNNRFFKRWTLAPEIEDELEAWDYRTFMHRCLVDLVHMQGFFVRVVRTRSARIGMPGRIARLEHIPYQRARLVYPPEGEDEPREIIVGDWPHPDPSYMERLPVFDPADPFRHPVSAKYYNIYSFAREWMSCFHIRLRQEKPSQCLR